MARLGVTYHDVANAAEQVLGHGKSPTIELVRQILRTGSTTTIANHLRKWRTEQEEAAGSSKRTTMPDELLSLMQGLWERTQHHADSRVGELEAQHQQAISALNQEIENHKAAIHNWQNRQEQWTKEKEDLVSRNADLRVTVETLKDEKNNLIAQVSAKDHHINEKNERITELHRLHSQTQANLEHFRESVHEQRLRDQQELDNQRQQSKAEIQALNHVLSTVKEKNSALIQQCQQLQQSYSSLEIDHTKLNKIMLEQSEKLQRAELAENEYRQSSQYWEGLGKEWQSKLDKMENKVINIQVENKIVSQQLVDMRLALDRSVEACRQLEIEKQTIEREKAILEGRLLQELDLAAASMANNI